MIRRVGFGGKFGGGDRLPRERGWPGVKHGPYVRRVTVSVRSRLVALGFLGGRKRAGRDASGTFGVTLRWGFVHVRMELAAFATSTASNTLTLWNSIG